MRWIAVAVSQACLAALTVSAHAQEPATLYDPGQLPAYHGQVQLFTLTPRGDIDGLVLTDGTEVKTPPHLSAQIASIFRPGATITVHGLKAAKLSLIQAMSVTNDADGRSVVDNGPGVPPVTPPVDSVENRPVAGQVRMALHGPRGEINGILLKDGTILKFPPPDFDRFTTLLSPGHAIAAEGVTRITAAGTVVEVTALGPSPEKLQRLE